MTTFADLGIPFPLFEADTRWTSEYVGIRRCSLCGEAGVHCFELGIGADIIVECPECSAPNFLDADDREDAECSECSRNIVFPDTDDEQLVACYSCLRSGKVALTKDTELGMVRGEDAQRGLTLGVPGLEAAEYDTVLGEDGWIQVRVPAEHLLELVRTPTYDSIQDERWQFCCRRPMTFIGEWEREDFTRNAPDGDGHAFFRKTVQDVVDGLWEDQLHDVTGIYVFKCKECGRLTAHWDIA